MCERNHKEQKKSGFCSTWVNNATLPRMTEHGEQEKSPVASGLIQVPQSRAMLADLSSQGQASQCSLDVGPRQEHTRLHFAD